MAKRRICLTETQLRNLVNETIGEMRKEQRDFTNFRQNLYLYETYLKEEYVQRYTGVWYNDKKIVESRGESEQVEGIVDKIYDAALRQIGEPQREGFNMSGAMRLHFEVDLGENAFIHMPIMDIFLTRSVEDKVLSGRFSPYLSSPIMNGKVEKPTFSLSMASTAPTLDYDVFSVVMSHEVMHAYRFFTVNTLYSKMPYGEELRNKRYQGFQPNKPGAGIEGWVRRLAYIMDQDEINAESAAFAAFLRNNREIDYTNYEYYFDDDTPLYKEYLMLSDAIEKINKVTDSKEMEEYGVAANKILYWGKMTPIKAFNTFRRKLNSACEYAVQQFYKILGKTMHLEGRQVPMENFQLLREWAKENGYGHRERYGKIIRRP